MIRCNFCQGIKRGHSHRRRAVMSGLLTVPVIATSVLVVGWWSAGCQPTPRVSSARIDQLVREPMIRVRIAQGVRQLSLDADDSLHITTQPDGSHLVADLLTCRWSQASKRIVLDPGASGRSSEADQLTVEVKGAGSLRVDGQPYPGRITLVAAPTRGGFDVVNHVRIEQYLPGVLDRELYSHWHPNMFQVQAIAARSYAIAEQARTLHRHFDLESTQASQVYGGQTVNLKALEAVRDTRGIVLTYEGHVLCAYYSSCTGGTGQDAAIAFPGDPDAKPLRGRRHGTWGSECKYYRWGPIIRRGWALSRRIAAWGKRVGHPVARVGRIASITVTRRNSVGRPARFTITDNIGRSYHLDPESFRLSCNFKTTRLSKLASDARLRSGHVTVLVSDGKVRFTDGRGFGHGVGLGQFGAQAMAKQGHAAAAILDFYYPQARLVAAY